MRTIKSFLYPVLLCGAFFALCSASPLVPQTPYAACQQETPSRFFEDLGGDYRLQLGSRSADIIGRKTWGADPPMPEGRLYTAYPKNQPVCTWFDRITVHHTDGVYTPQSLQTFHQFLEDPKADIAYHFFIDTDGLIYEGRPLGRMGSHSESDNGHNVGIVLNGNFEKEAPAESQLNALWTLLDALDCPCYQHPIWTHRQRKQLRFPNEPEKWTTCPGDQLHAAVMAYAEKRGRKGAQ